MTAPKKTPSYYDYSNPKVGSLVTYMNDLGVVIEVIKEANSSTLDYGIYLIYLFESMEYKKAITRYIKRYDGE
jgi:hypothetical protein